jgi:hypothetical protein
VGTASGPETALAKLLRAPAIEADGAEQLAMVMVGDLGALR